MVDLQTIYEDASNALFDLHIEGFWFLVTQYSPEQWQEALVAWKMVGLEKQSALFQEFLDTEGDVCADAGNPFTPPYEPSRNWQEEFEAILAAQDGGFEAFRDIVEQFRQKHGLKKP